MTGANGWDWINPLEAAGNTMRFRIFFHLWRKCVCISAFFIAGSSGICAQAGYYQTTIGDTSYTLTINALRSSRLKATFQSDTTRIQLVNRASRLLDSLGYFSARIDTADTPSARWNLTSGLRSELVTIAILGLDTLPPEGVLPRLPRPYDAATVAATMQALTSFAGEQGYPFATVSLTLADDSTGPTGALKAVLEIHRGPRCRIEQIRIIGNKRTRTAQVLSDLALSPGALWSPLANTLSLDRLTSRAYIESARLLSLRVHGPADQDTAAITLTYEITERSGMGLDGAVGIEAVRASKWRPAGSLDFSLINILGSGDRAAILYRGNADQQQLNAAIGKTRIGPLRGDLDLGFTLDIRDSEYGKMGGYVSAVLDIARRWQAGVRLDGNETTQSDSAAATRRYGGLDLLLRRSPEPRSAGSHSMQAEIATGSGVALHRDSRSNRWHSDIELSLQVPFGAQWSGMAGLVLSNLFTREDSLSGAEKYRTGGHRSIRGYPENQFAFMHRGYLQSELLWYFAPRGALYLFCDAGAGFFDQLDLSDKNAWHAMLGYGAGIRIPVRIGTASIEWGRSIDDRGGLGRIHVRFANALSHN